MRPGVRARIFGGTSYGSVCWDSGGCPSTYRPPRHDRNPARAVAGCPGGPGATRGQFVVVGGDTRSMKQATVDLTRLFLALSARVAALEPCPAMRAEDGATSSDDAEAAAQRTKFARSAAGKARRRSSHLPRRRRDSRPRATSTPSHPSPPPTATSALTSALAEELVLLRLAGLTTRNTAGKACKRMSGALPSGTPAPVEVGTLAVHDYIALKYRSTGIGLRRLPRIRCLWRLPSYVYEFQGEGDQGRGNPSEAVCHPAQERCPLAVLSGD